MKNVIIVLWLESEAIKHVPIAAVGGDVRCLGFWENNNISRDKVNVDVLYL